MVISKNNLEKEGRAEEGGGNFYLSRIFIKREGGREEKKIVPRNGLICPFLLNLTHGSKDVQITPILCHPYFSFISEMIESALFFINFTYIFSSYGTYTGEPRLRCHQSMPGHPIF